MSEILLFNDDEDKERYLIILKKYSDRYRCSIYAYCLMSNHLHIHLDPKGFDISKFMHSVNTSYVLYYNSKYKRHGHLFQGRFHSRVLHSNSYNLAVSAYIHKNPKDITEYKGREEEYEYSSFGVYIGIRKDKHGIIDCSFVQSITGIINKKVFKKRYFEFVTKSIDTERLNQFDQYEESAALVANECHMARQVVIRNRPISDIISYIAKKLPGRNSFLPASRSIHSDFTAFAAYTLRVLCGLGYRQICEELNNVTISSCSRLCDKGYALSCQKERLFASIFDDLFHSNVNALYQI